MKVRDLLQQIADCRKEFGDDFLDWEVFTEQICEQDKLFKKSSPAWKFITDSQGWEYLECTGFWTKFPDKKIFTINVNY